MKKILKYLLLIIIGMAVGLLLGNYRWDYESQEQYCHKCGLTQVIEKEKSILTPEGIVKGKFSDHKSFLSAYLDDSDSCHHVWTTYQRFPVVLERNPSDEMNHRISMIYWYNWNDMNEWAEGQKLIAEMYENNPQKTTELLKKSFNPDNLIAFDDVSAIFKLDISWDKKWFIWDNFLNNYDVYKGNTTAQAVFHNSDSTQIITWNFQGGDYTRTPINWQYVKPE